MSGSRHTRGDIVRMGRRRGPGARSQHLATALPLTTLAYLLHESLFTVDTLEAECPWEGCTMVLLYWVLGE